MSSTSCLSSNHESVISGDTWGASVYQKESRWKGIRVKINALPHHEISHQVAAFQLLMHFLAAAASAAAEPIFIQGSGRQFLCRSIVEVCPSMESAASCWFHVEILEQHFLSRSTTLAPKTTETVSFSPHSLLIDRQHTSFLSLIYIS